MRLIWICCLALVPLTAVRAEDPPPKPILYLIGDSTVNNGTKGQQGWGSVLAPWVDAQQASVVNKARGGRSSRTYRTEGLWDEVVKLLRTGDIVLMQFGHNDGGGLSDPRGRASIKGNGDETAEATNAQTGAKETVHSYGWYLRQYCAEAKAKGAIPVVLSPVPRNMWKDGKVGRSTDYGKWAKEAAEQVGAMFVDLNGLIADRYDAIGEEEVGKRFFGPTDHTHTVPEGARLNAECVVAGLRALPGNPFGKLLLEKPAG